MTKKISQKILDFLLLSILAVVPLIYTVHFYNSFRLAKTSFFIIFTSLALIFAVWIFVRKNFYFWKNYKWLLILIGGLFVFKIISFILSINPYISFWGGYSKLEGFVTWTFYLIYFLILAFNFIDKKKRKIFTFIIIASTFILSLISILQHYGVIGEKWSGNIQMRAIGSLGNPIHLSAFMMFTIPISLYGIYRFKNYALKAFVAAALLLQFFILIFTQSRSSWATFVILFIFIAFLYLFKYSKSWLIIFSIAAVLFVSGFVYMGKTNADAISNKYVSRAFSVLDTTDNSNKQRLYFWQGSWNAFLAKPLFGWGQDNLKTAFDLHYPAKLTDLPETRIDRAHNVFLDMLAEEGIFSFVFFLAILTYIFYLSVKLFFNKNSKEKNWIGFWGIWFVLGYCLQYFFMYPVISAYVIIFFVFSQVAYAALIDQKETDETSSKPISQKKQIVSVVPAVILFIFIFCFGVLPRLKANYYYTNSVKRPQKAEFLLQKAYETWPSPYFRTNLASYYMRSAFANLKNNSKIVDLYLAKAKGLFLKELKVFPENYLCYANLGSIYNLYSDFQNSDKNFQQAVMISPRHDLYWTWADNVHIRKDFEKATVLYKKAIEIDPEIALPYYKLSLYLKKIGQNDQAQKYFETAVEKGLKDWQMEKSNAIEIKTSTDLNQSSADKTTSP